MIPPFSSWILVMAEPRSDASAPSLGESAPLVPPLYQSSVYTLPDLDALDRIMNAEEPGFIYARDAHPNARHLAARLAALEGADWAVVCGSGMAAISAILLATLEQGDRVVASNRLYGRTTQLLGPELGRFGVRPAVLASSPFDCWLAERGLATLALRMRAASANAAALADWLAGVPDVAGVVYPGRPDHPDHELAQRLLRGGFGNMLCFELKGGREAVN